MKKYLILGASGLLGEKLALYLKNSHGTFFSNKSAILNNTSFLDLTDAGSFRMLLERVQPNVVINCTGMTDVDMCELLPEKCWNLNCWNPFLVAQECTARNVKYIHISTDHFSNPSGMKLREDDNAIALNQYGYSKLSAEKLILLANNKSIVVRANFFHFNTNSPKTYMDRVLFNAKLNTVSYSFSDVVFTPISTFFLSACIEKLVDISFSGIVNIASSKMISKYEFHEAVLREFNAPRGFHFPVLLNSIKAHTKRPPFMALDNTLLNNLLGIKVPNIYDMIKMELQLS